MNTWDFTHTVRFWTDGKRENHGFGLYGDYMTAHTRVGSDAKNCPAVFVISVPK